MCLYTKIVRNPKYIGNKKNKGNPPKPKRQEALWIPIACGNCKECRKKRAREWMIRLMYEMKKDRTGKFVTLTFTEEALTKAEQRAQEKKREKNIKKEKPNDSDIPNANEVATVAVRDFLERWRAKHKKSVKHWFVTELGHKGTERLHLHGILYTKEDKEEIKARWGNGRIDVGYKMDKTCIKYIMKYVMKVDKDHKGFVSKVLPTKGIGAGFLETFEAKHNEFKGKETIEYIKTSDGNKVMMPTYWRNKYYTEEQREELWMHKIDAGVAWVGGNKIENIHSEKGYKRLKKATEWAQRESKKQGYGDGSKKKEYLARKTVKNLEVRKI